MGGLLAGLVRKRSFFGDRGIWGEIMLGNTDSNKTVLTQNIAELSSSFLHFLGGVGKLAMVFKRELWQSVY